MIETKKMQLYILSGETAPAAFRDAHEKTYALWEKVWCQTYKEIDGTEHVPSDNFIRQHEILSLFFEGECCALVCHRYVDLSLKSAMKDSYFNPWSQESMEKLKSQGPNVALGSQITIHPDFRKTKLGGHVKELTTYLSLRQLMERKVDAISGMMRVDKGMNKLFYDSGAHPVATEVVYRNFQLDLVAFFPRLTPLKIDPQFKSAVENLWQNRLAQDADVLRQVA